MKKFRQKFSTFTKKEKTLYVIECIMIVIGVTFFALGLIKDNDALFYIVDYMLYSILILSGIRNFDDNELLSIISVAAGIIGFIVKTIIIIF